jgi:hypothetical protein
MEYKNWELVKMGKNQETEEDGVIKVLPYNKIMLKNQVKTS